MLLSTTLPTTLCLAAAAIIINIWLGTRIGKLRHSEKVSVGDGGNESLLRRMRAQANFIENVPVTLILIAAIELAGKGGAWLAPVGAVFMLGRIFHALGMDTDGLKWGRPIGMLTSMVPQLGLSVVAVVIALGRM